MCRLHIFVFDSHLATLLESKCPFGFPLVMFLLGSSYFVFVFLFFDVPDERCGIIVSVPKYLQVLKKFPPFVMSSYTLKVRVITH